MTVPRGLFLNKNLITSYGVHIRVRIVRTCSGVLSPGRQMCPSHTQHVKFYIEPKFCEMRA